MVLHQRGKPAVEASTRINQTPFCEQIVNYLFLGDAHGDLDFVVRACEIAARYSAEIIQVGDWGFIWPVRDSGSAGRVHYDENQLDKLSSVLITWGVTMRFIDGNHDWHPHLRNVAGMDGPNELAPRVIYQPRGSMYTDPEGTSFVFVGGAPSIDKSFRKDGISWWREEEITDEEVEKALYHKTCDVLVTHDAPDYPPSFLPKGDDTFRVKSRKSLNNVRSLRTALKPRLHVHGHWHYAYVDGVTRGLDCNYAIKFGDAYYLWDSKNAG